MQDLIEEPPSRKRLKQVFLDSRRRDHPSDVLNCAAHLILAIDDPDELASVALDYLVGKLGVCRADLGFPAPTDAFYAPVAVCYSPVSDPPRCDGVAYRNQAEVFRRTWRQGAPVACDDVASHSLLADCREEFEAIDSRSIMFQRLTFARRPVGMMCLDFTHDSTSGPTARSNSSASSAPPFSDRSPASAGAGEARPSSACRGGRAPPSSRRSDSPREG